MKYIYDVVLHNAASITIERACLLANMIQDHIDTDGTHVQAVSLEKQTDVKITIETSFKLEELFSLIYDNRPSLGYTDFSIYYSEDYDKVVLQGFGE
jgi:hypothetical protein